MDIQSVGWMISAISVGYLICSLARPVIVGRRIHIAVPWLESRVGEATCSSQMGWSATCRRRAIQQLISCMGRSRRSRV